MPKFYLTTTLPYVNSVPHMGHALEFVLADIIVRYERDVLGNDVFFNTGTDEHGLKIYRRAQEENLDTQAFTDKYAEVFKQILAPTTGLNISFTNFIRTTDPAHKLAAQKFWKRCEAKGDIYKKLYQTKYCVGCELEKTDSELVNGKCPLHPNLEIELVDEENFFFRFSNYQQPLLDLYQKNPDFVVPASRQYEITKFVEAGLEDFSISRLKTKMPWGVPVPGSEDQVMYVWFDALVNYVSTLGWPNNAEQFAAFWGTQQAPNALQIAGKDNLRQQSAMWQAMLLSADLPTSKQIIIHGFITSGGQKMSKSLGNVIDPFEVIQKYGSEALRYFLAREISTFEDSDFTWERFQQSYNSGLANGIGNLVSRTLKMAISNNVDFSSMDEPLPESKEILTAYDTAFAAHDIKAAAEVVWSAIAAADQFIAETEPYKKVKVDAEAAKQDIVHLLKKVFFVNQLLAPFMPETSAKITDAFKNPTLETIPRLFPRAE